MKPRQTSKGTCVCFKNWLTFHIKRAVVGFRIFLHNSKHMTSVEWDYQILFSCALISSTGPKWQTYIHQFKPIWSHLQLWVDAKTRKASLQKKGRLSFKAISFFSFIFFTPFYLPLVHTIEAIVAFPAAKTSHKVLSNLCHMACLCFALPTASPLK